MKIRQEEEVSLAMSQVTEESDLPGDPSAGRPSTLSRRTEVGIRGRMEGGSTVEQWWEGVRKPGRSKDRGQYARVHGVWANLWLDPA